MKWKIIQNNNKMFNNQNNKNRKNNQMMFKKNKVKKWCKLLMSRKKKQKISPLLKERNRIIQIIRFQKKNKKNAKIRKAAIKQILIKKMQTLLSFLDRKLIEGKLKSKNKWI